MLPRANVDLLAIEWSEIVHPAESRCLRELREDYNRESTFKQRRANERFAEITRGERRLILTLDQTANSGKHNERRRRMKIWHDDDSSHVCRIVDTCFLQQRKMVHADNFMAITHWNPLMCFISDHFLMNAQVIAIYNCYSMIGIF